MTPSESTPLPFEPWIREVWGEPESLERLPGDVSPRRYVRAVRSGESVIAVRYPASQLASGRRFLETTELLQRAGVVVPEILVEDLGHGFMLIADVGRRSLYETGRNLTWEELVPLYRVALGYLERIRGIPGPAVEVLSPPLDGPALRAELETAWEYALAPLGLTGDSATEPILATALDTLCRELGRGPLVPTHRDYMVRNLQLGEGASGTVLTVLDHQDLRLGPDAYDLASLLHDSLFPPPAVEESLGSAYLTDSSSRTQYHRAVVQRSLKAVGTYQSFAARGFDRHLGLVSPTLGRAWRCFHRVPELAPLVPRLRTAWRPRLPGDLVE